MSQDKNVNEALKLIELIRRRLVRRHMSDLGTLFLLAGLSVAAIPLGVAKFRFQEAWMSSWLPGFTVVLATLGGGVLAWSCRPGAIRAARAADKALGTKELFLTALTVDASVRRSSSLHDLFSRDLAAAVARADTRTIVPSRLAPTAKLLGVMIFINAVLLATPDQTPPDRAQIALIQQRLATMTKAAPLLTEEERSAVDKMQNARSRQELEKAAKQMWKELQEQRRVEEEKVKRTAQDLAQALRDGRIADAGQTLDNLERQLSTSTNQSLKGSIKKELRRLAASPQGSPLQARLSEAGQEGKGAGAGKGKSGTDQDKAEGEVNRQKIEFMNDLLLSVFSGMGQELPEENGAGKDERGESLDSRDTPGFRPTKKVDALSLDAVDRAVVLDYLKLRHSRR